MHSKLFLPKISNSQRFFYIYLYYITYIYYTSKLVEVYCKRLPSDWHCTNDCIIGCPKKSINSKFLGHLTYVIFSAYLFIYLKRPYLFIVRIIEQMNSDWIFRNKGWILSSFFFILTIIFLILRSSENTRCNFIINYFGLKQEEWNRAMKNFPTFTSMWEQQQSRAEPTDIQLNTEQWTWTWMWMRHSVQWSLGHCSGKESSWHNYTQRRNQGREMISVSLSALRKVFYTFFWNEERNLSLSNFYYNIRLKYCKYFHSFYKSILRQ